MVLYMGQAEMNLWMVQVVMVLLKAQVVRHSTLRYTDPYGNIEKNRCRSFRFEIGSETHNHGFHYKGIQENSLLQKYWCST